MLVATDQPNSADPGLGALVMLLRLHGIGADPAQIRHRFAGTPIAFMISFGIIVGWAILGPVFHFSDSWQLVINTSTTIVTFLMVFLIQNTQNRDAKAMHLKLDELIRALKRARNEMVDLEELSDEELNKLEDQFRRVRKRAEKHGTNMRHAEPEALEHDTQS